MNGHKFLKVTGILMIIAAVFSIIAGVLVGGLGALGVFRYTLAVCFFIPQSVWLRTLRKIRCCHSASRTPDISIRRPAQVLRKSRSLFPRQTLPGG